MMRRLFIGAVISFVLITIFLVSISFSFRTDRIWIDPVTCSWKYQTDWIFGIKSKPRSKPSKLEYWIIEREGKYQNDWQYLTGIYKNIWGRGIASGSGRGSPIISLRNGEIMETFILISTDEELSRFVNIMRTGSRAEERAAVEKALEKVWASYGHDD